MLRNGKEFFGDELWARDGRIGHVKDLFFDDREWRLRYFVVDTGTWLNRRDVLISPLAVRAPEWDNRVLPVDLTRDQVRNSPQLDVERPFSREHEAELSHYYNWPVYWGTAGFLEASFAPPLLPAEIVSASTSSRTRRHRRAVALHEEPHMRSARAVAGFAIEATDGEVGHVDDFVIEDRSWTIRYVVIDTRNWWPGKRVLLAPERIDDVDWEGGRVLVELTRHALESSPAYDPAKAITADYAERLNDYYERPEPGP